MIEIDEILKSKGLTQTELAKKLGMPRQNLNRLIKSDDIKLSYVIRIAQELDVPIESLLGTEHNINVGGHYVHGIDAKAQGNVSYGENKTELEKVLLENEYLKKEVESLKALVDEKERLITILMKQKD